ncbi:o-succinylbenzoate synthase [Veillonella sp. VA142]|uniref:o-succinylbenzoate synthase n=1 Tax=Veillonella sp. VA142 TaxID=741834 RepID=UPI000F8CE6E7|nr:o-succinylbenzoate synthase [Veillonella sp. VA142]
MITNITLYHVQLPMKFTFKTAKGELGVRDTLIVRLEDEAGYVGYGECVAFVEPFYTKETVASCWDVLCTQYLPNVLGKEATMTLPKRWLSEGMPMTVASVENALLHLQCAHLGVNTVEYVLQQPLIPTVPTGIVIGDVPLDTLVDAVTGYVSQGCQRIKLKVSPKDGYERVQRVRSAYPDLMLAVDANQSYSYQDMDKVRALNTFNLACIEEPFQIYSLEEYNRFKTTHEWSITTPICLDESILNYDDLVYAHTHGLLDILNVKVGRLGGLRETAKMIQYCRDHGIQYWIGSMVESSISKWMHVQLAALGDAYMPGDLSDSLRYFEQDLTRPPIVSIRKDCGAEGLSQCIEVPKGAGLGVDVDLEMIETRCKRKKLWHL